MIISLNKRISSIFLFLAILSIFSFYLNQYLHTKNHSGKSEALYLTEHIDIQSIKLLKYKKLAENILSNNPYNYWNILDSLFNREKYICFVANQDSLRYWNTNKVDIETARFQLIIDNNVHIINLPSGWYLYSCSNIESKKISILELIKTEFLLNNELLTSEYNSNYSNSSNINLTLDINESSHKIYNTAGEFILGTNYIDTKSDTPKSDYLSFILYLVSYIFIILTILTKITNLKLTKSYPTISFIILIFIIIFIRFLEITINFPYELKISPIFSNNIFNITTAKSEGGLILTTILLLLVSISASIIFGKNKTRVSATNIIFRYVSLSVYMLLVIYMLFHTILDQQISFFSEDLLHNNALFLSIIITIGINTSIYYVLVTFLKSEDVYKTPFVIPFIIVSIAIFTAYIITNITITIIIITLVATFIIIILKQIIWKFLSNLFLNHLIILLLLSITTSIIVSKAFELKNDNYQIYIGKTLAISNDTIFENNYKKINNDITNDKNLQNLIFNNSLITDAEIQEYILANFFNKTSKKYSIQITNCGNREYIEIQPEGEIRVCSEYFNQTINEFTTSVIDTILYRFNSGTESNYYISRITIVNTTNNIKHELFIEFVSSHVPEGFGYPELLIDKQSHPLNLTAYSFAIYTSDRLTYKFGDYAYNTFLNFNRNFKFNKFFNYNNYHHYGIQISPHRYLIISREKTPTTLNIVVFSIIFLILTILSVILYLVIYARSAFTIYRLNLKARLQTFFISTLTITFLLMGVTTLIYIKDSNKEALEKQLTEKTNSVLIELQHKLSSVKNLKDEDGEVLHQLLRKFSLVFFSDINLYDKSGKLIATSRPEIFEKNLLSSYINPLAFNAIFNDNKINFITEENIGSLKYYSAFVPINLNNDMPIGIVNLPYFARQTQITRSYYIMLSYLINIYVIISIIGALIAIIFSRYLTKPLVLLQESLKTIRIDKHNEKIQWNKNDEIGLLINEYNLMVDKLEQSADLLKHSERESAWREVAQQIAHEIKNPLTPMKLNVQYLEKAYKNNDPDFGLKINSISKSLITQIDVLNEVAEMFSNFAKSKSLKLVKVNLKSVITSAVNLFNKNDDITITTNYNNDKELYTQGFEKDILRVINNILKNAIQSIDKNTVGKINIKINQDNKFITIAITDNGKGIPEEMKSKIFHPYFTTKTSGTGLGLAIVKNIMNEIGGKVSFEDAENGGTRFLLLFPNIS